MLPGGAPAGEVLTIVVEEVVARLAELRLSTRDHLLPGVETVVLTCLDPTLSAELRKSRSPNECASLAPMLATQVDHLHAPLATHPHVPLQVHGRYSRIEILAAFGIGTGAKIAAWQTGVYEAKDEGAELLAFTLDKSSGSFSPTTR